MSQTEDWRRTSPLAALFFLGRLIRGVVKNAAQSIAPLAAALVALGGSLTDRLILIGTVAMLLGITISVLRYLFFRFQVTADSVLIRDGIFTKKQLDIKFDRIQGVNTEQNFIYRWFDLVNIEFDTAGSASSEGRLPAVGSNFADELQRKINGHRVESDEAEIEAVAPDPLLELGWRDMIRIGLADGRVLVVFAILGPFLEQMGDEIDSLISAYADDAVERLAGFGVAGGSLIVIALILGIALLLATASIAAAFFRYHRFQLFRDGRTLRSVGGLTTSHRVAMDTRKVQRVRLSQGLIYRWFGVFRLAAQQATSSGSQKESNIFKVPLVSPAFGEDFGRQIFAPEAGDIPLAPGHPDFRRVSRRYVTSRFLIIGVLPLLLATPSVFVLGPAAVLLLAWPLLVFPLVLRYWQRLAYLHNDDALVRRSGLLGYRLDLLLFRKVQRVTLTQSLLQRRRGLAGLDIFLASGSVKIPYLPIEDARRLRDYILFKVESSRLAWH